MLVHTQVKLYICEICGKKFAQKFDCERHARIHTGEKPIIHKVKHGENKYYCCEI